MVGWNPICVSIWISWVFPNIGGRHFPTKRGKGKLSRQQLASGVGKFNIDTKKMIVWSISSPFKHSYFFLHLELIFKDGWFIPRHHLLWAPGELLVHRCQRRLVKNGRVWLRDLTFFPTETRNPKIDPCLSSVWGDIQWYLLTKRCFNMLHLLLFSTKKQPQQLNSTQLNSSWTPESDPSASPSVRSYVAVARVPKPISDIPSARRVVALMAWRREILEKWVWAQKREIRILKNKKHHLSLSTFLSFCQVQGIEPSLFKMGNQRKPCHIEPRFPFFHEVNSKLTWDAIFMMQIT